MSFSELREEALRARAAGEDREATQPRIHAARRLRAWTDAEGAWNLSARATVVDGSKVMRVLNPIIDDLFEDARRDGRRDERDTYASDARVRLAEPHEPETKNPSPKYLGLLRIDWEALVRGDVRDDELCEITGLGPIPATTARELLGDAILELVITKGVDVLHVTHLGRGPTAAQRVALAWSSPGCRVEGCPRTRVEIDHRDPYAQTRQTRLDELDPLCRLHHHQKHHEGWSLVEGTGKRAFVPPDDPRHPKSRPKRE
ncbi:MAG TPA: HNH endonuclease signature motif containing protein [Acidimicrobiia bacterium]